MSKPVVPWIGGKSRLAKHILPLFPKHTTYVEPFCGAAALFWLKDDQANVEVLNDIDGELVNLYRVIKHHLEPFITEFKWALTSRQMYEWLKITVPDTLTDIQRAARFFYLQKLAFGGKTTGRTFGTSATRPPRMNILRIEEDLSEAHLRLANVYLEHLDWKACIEKYDREGTLFYLDPPYWKVQGYGVPFELEEYERMAELARTIKGRMIISINDHEEMRRVYRGLKTIKVDIKYTCGNVAKAKSQPRHELIITSYK